MEIIIKKMKYYPQFVETAARWAYHEWHERNRTPYSLVKKDYSLRKNDSTLPITWLALYKEFPVGMVTLKKHDLSNRKDLSPWLSSLYVEPEFRHLGIGKNLVTSVLNFAQGRGCSAVFLFTDRSDNEGLTQFYKKLGWTVYASSHDLHKYPVTIMKYGVRKKFNIEV